jgi:hypothetical protein
MASVKKTVVDLSFSDHITYIHNDQAHDRSHALDAPHVRTHVEQTGSAIQKSKVSELVGSDLTPSTWMHCEQPPGDRGRVNRYFGSTICPIEKSPEQIEELIEAHAGTQEAMLRFAKCWGDLSRLLLEARARLLAITPG